MKLKSIPLPLPLAVSMLLLVACKEESKTSDLLTAKEESLTSALLTAIDKRQSDVVQNLLDSGIYPNKDAGPEGANPLHLAALKGNKQIV